MNRSRQTKIENAAAPATKIAVYIYNEFLPAHLRGSDDAVRNTFYLPATRVVCDDCEGCGFVLNDAMRHHAYTVEEFKEEFDEEMQEEYFRRGGAYDVRCPTCEGLRVIDVINHEAVAPESREAEILKALDSQEREEDYQEAERAAERRMGC